MSSIHIARTVPVDDFEVKAREVVAYAAVFDEPTKIVDAQGEYWESIGRGAFDVTIQAFNDRREADPDSGDPIKAMVNHGRDIYGQPTGRFALPWGTVIDMRADGRGLLTTTRALPTQLGNEILAMLEEGALSGFSFSGRVLQTTEVEPARPGDLPLYVRREIQLREFGPAVWQAYDGAQLVALRSGQPIPLPDEASGGQKVAGEPSMPPDGAPAARSAPARPEQGDSSPQHAAGGPNAALQWLREYLPYED